MRRLFCILSEVSYVLSSRFDVDAALKGLGVVQLPDYYVTKHLESGERWLLRGERFNYCCAWKLTCQRPPAHLLPLFRR